jgi:protein-tyrosine sulfotransferase
MRQLQVPESALGREGTELGSFADPVFVLCNGRSGSTLLRFLLDAHPDLACPPETNLPSLCAPLATVWSLIEGAPLSANRGDEPPQIPAAAIQGIRETLDRMVGSYLTRRGKTRYCDKSLGSARYAELLARVYPDAKFICLYRHPMDVIASGLEACPWGLTGYGFEPYIAMSPGNAVLAIAQFWADNAAAILAAEEELGDSCLRVRYEDLVSDPENVAAGIFRFLGAAPAPGISRACFSADRERFGPADHKIWYTSAISSASVGRGWSVPAAMIAPELTSAINELAGKLGYVAVDGAWGTTAPPADLRVAQAAGAGGPTAQGAEGGDAPSDPGGNGSAAAAGHGREPELSAELGGRLRDGLDGLDPGIPGSWHEYAGESFVLVWIPSDPARPAEHWLVSLPDRTVTFTDGAAQDGSAWDVVGSADAWQQVLSGQLNLNVALRAYRLRYCDGDDTSPPTSEARVAILARLLGLTSW